MALTKKEVLENLEQVKGYINEIENKKEEKVVGIAIMSRFGGVKFQSTKTTFKEAAVEGKADLRDADLSDADLHGANLHGANLSDADLRDADLSDADLSGAELCSTKFYGRGGTKHLKRSQLPDFLGALGFVIED